MNVLTSISPKTRDDLLAAAHAQAVERFQQFQIDLGCGPEAWIAFRAGYQNAVIDILGGLVGREAMIP